MEQGCILTEPQRCKSESNTSWFCVLLNRPQQSSFFSRLILVSLLVNLQDEPSSFSCFGNVTRQIPGITLKQLCSNNNKSALKKKFIRITCWPWFMARQEQEIPNWKRNTMKRMTMYCGKAAVVKDYTTFRWENLDLPFYGHWTTKTGSTQACKGYKEKHDLVMMDGSNESHNGDQQQKEAHGNHAADDVDAGDNAKAFPPCCYDNQQETHQLEMRKTPIRNVSHLTIHTIVWKHYIVLKVNMNWHSKPVLLP